MAAAAAAPPPVGPTLTFQVAADGTITLTYTGTLVANTAIPVWHEARRELLVLWNVYAFFVTYARLAGWTPAEGVASSLTAGWPALDRWILSRAAALAARVEGRLREYDAVGATRELSAFIDDLSTWYLRLSRDRMRRTDDAVDRERAFAEYFFRRKENADALADLAVENFIEMRDKTASRVFRAKKKLDHLLEGLLPGIYLPLYTMVTFTRIPYAEAARRARTQDRIEYGTFTLIVLIVALTIIRVAIG